MGETHKVPAVTLDSMSEQYGPFQNAVLCLDIEGAEVEALKGAEQLLQRGAIKVFNAEVFNTTEHEIASFLKRFGLIEMERWGHQISDSESGREWWNIIYILQ